MVACLASRNIAWPQGGGRQPMTKHSSCVSEDITGLLTRASDGDADARQHLIAAVYQELREMAHRQLRREYGARSVSTTELVHEAYLKLGANTMPSDNRAHFFSAAARAMRQVLIDLARKRKSEKRGGDVPEITLDAERIELDRCSSDLIALNDALNDLARLDQRLAKVVECRFFGGLSVEETAIAMESSPRTVKRDWRKARAWLFTAVAGPPQ